MLRRLRARVPDGLQGSEQTGSVERRRVHAARTGDVVVFHVGMRINTFWKLHRWLPILLVAHRLVGQLRGDPEAGLLGSWTFVSPPRTIGFVQYWASFDALRDYARDSEHGHVDAWQEYSERADEGAVGIWHETYRVEDYETVYNNTPPRGLGAADGSELVGATGRLETATGRIGSPGDADDVRQPESERRSGY